eukprot:277446_1
MAGIQLNTCGKRVQKNIWILLVLILSTVVLSYTLSTLWSSSKNSETIIMSIFIPNATQITIQNHNSILNISNEQKAQHIINTSKCLSSDTIFVLILSCGRWNELSETIESFELYNTYKCLKRKIVMDDCNDIIGLNKMSDKYHKLYNYEFFTTNTPRNSTYSQVSVRTILSIYESIIKYGNDCKYVFQIEDDWKFYRHGFIQDSLSILKSHEMKLRYDHYINPFAPQIKISMVNLRNKQIYK